MTDAEYSHEPRTCRDCEETVTVGILDGQFGMYCGCTVTDGRPFKVIENRYRWPERW